MLGKQPGAEKPPDPGEPLDTAMPESLHFCDKNQRVPFSAYVSSESWQRTSIVMPVPAP